MKKVAVIGAAAVGDYIFKVDHLPEKGEIVAITQEPGKLIPGGCAPNIACGMANLGRTIPVLKYPVGRDFDELDLLQYWEERGVICSLTRVKDSNSGCAWMYMQEDGTTMCFGYPGAAETAEAEERLEESIVVIAPKLNNYTRGYLKKAIEKKCMIIVTGIGDARLLPYMKDMDVLVINICEANQLCKAGEFRDTESLSAAFPGLRLYVTNGSKGSSLYRNGEVVQIPIVKPEQIRDFTGAGDAFTSGIVSALAAGYSDVQAAYIGACASSFAIEQMGGQTWDKDWETVMRRLEEQYPQWKNEKNKSGG